MLRRRPLPDIPPVHPHSVLDRVYRGRGIAESSELDHRLSGLLPPNGLKGIREATIRLADAIQAQQKILVIGDYDCDGATGTAIAVEGLRLLSAEQVDFLVPNRFDYGYGLSPAIVALAAERRPDLILTVDNGISSPEGARAVKELPWGCQIIITDHHLAPEVLPEADAIVNPNQPGCGFQSKALAGCGVMFYLLLALRALLRDELGRFPDGKAPSLNGLLDLAALGTVADVVPLDRNNRILVTAGLRLINTGQARPGIRELLRLSGSQVGKITSTDLGFRIGPRVNAAGRLADISTGIRCLLAQDVAQAEPLAVELDTLNRQRREIESEVKDSALEQIERYDAIPHGICVYDPGYHQGVVGIVASRIRERYHRPVIVLTDDAADPTLVKGSARSIPGFHLRDALCAVATRHPDLITKFGGHAMAAGLTLPRERLSAFRVAFAQEALRQLTEEQLQDTALTDGELAPAEISLETAERLTWGGPWGQGFEEPLFDGEFVVIGHRVLKDKHLKMRLRHPDGGESVDAIAFNAEDTLYLWAHSGVPRRIGIVYRLDVNEYQGNRQVQLAIRGFQ